MRTLFPRPVLRDQHCRVRSSPPPPAPPEKNGQGGGHRLFQRAKAAGTEKTKYGGSNSKLGIFSIDSAPSRRLRTFRRGTTKRRNNYDRKLNRRATQLITIRAYYLSS